MNSYFDILRAGTVLGRKNNKNDNNNNKSKGGNPGTIQKASSIFLGGEEEDNNIKELKKPKKHSHRGGGKNKNKRSIEGEGINEDDDDKADIDVFDGDKEVEEEKEGTITVEEDDDDEVDREEIKKDKKKKIISPARRVEMANHYRKDNKIGVSGTSNIPDPILTFNNNNDEEEEEDNRISKWLKDAMVKSGFPTPTPIQSQAIPLMLTGHHLLAQAPTGSGKTLAFIVPVLQRLARPEKKFCRCIIVDPTRELAVQTVREADRLVQSCSKKFRIKLLDKNTNVKRLDIGVHTPLGLVQALKDGTLSINDTQVIIFDEGDKLLDLGFQEQIDEIIKFATDEDDRRRTAGNAIPPIQLALFSATMPDNVVHLMTSVMDPSPNRVWVGQQGSAAKDVQQRLLFCGNEEGKLVALRRMITSGEVKPPCLAFVQSKARAQELTKELMFDGVFVACIHSDMTRKQRDTCIDNFRLGKIWILICTDVMARGVDFKGVQQVINIDLPRSSATYIHRVGRTGRAGNKGEAVTMFTMDDKPYLRPIISVMKQSGLDIPEWLNNLPNPKKGIHNNNKNSEYKKPLERGHLTTLSGYDRQRIAKRKQMIAMSKEKNIKKKSKTTTTE